MNIADCETIDFPPYPRFRNLEDAKSYQECPDLSLCVPPFVVVDVAGRERVHANPDYYSAPYEIRLIKADETSFACAIVKK